MISNNMDWIFLISLFCLTQWCGFVAGIVLNNLLLFFNYCKINKFLLMLLFVLIDCFIDYKTLFVSRKSLRFFFSTPGFLYFSVIFFPKILQRRVHITLRKIHDFNPIISYIFEISQDWAFVWYKILVENFHLQFFIFSFSL